MKTPEQLAAQLGRQWQQADLREQRLLDGASSWPLSLSIGLPSASEFENQNLQVMRHVQQWREIAAHGPGQVEWLTYKYRRAGTPVDIPKSWLLAGPLEWVAAAQDPRIRADYRALSDFLPQVDARFRRVLVRRFALWRGLSAQTIRQATQVALQLQPGCAAGLPLRALAIAGNDSKFFERHEPLLRALLDVLYDGQAGRQGLAEFLGASKDNEHWLLVAPLTDGLLPFPRLRVRTTDLLHTPLPCGHILVVENERSLHQIPALADTIAILGAGLDLAWMAAPWLRQKRITYWGDMDTWGLTMLARARSYQPHLHAALMNQTEFEYSCHMAVPEPVGSDICPLDFLQSDEQAFFHFLSACERGRLEQEFLPRERVMLALRDIEDLA